MKLYVTDEIIRFDGTVLILFIWLVKTSVDDLTHIQSFCHKALLFLLQVFTFQCSGVQLRFFSPIGPNPTNAILRTVKHSIFDVVLF
jgi:hypothetical protein